MEDNIKKAYVMLEKKAEVALAQKRLLLNLKHALDYKGKQPIGYHGGKVDAPVYANSAMWFAYQKFAYRKFTYRKDGKNDGRYWNVFGKGDFDKAKNKTIIVEINPRFEGNSKDTGGLFAQNGKGEIFLCHNGSIGGGRKGVSKKLFWGNFPHKKKIVYVLDSNDKLRKAVEVTAVDASNIAGNIGKFIIAIDEIKHNRNSGK